MDHHCVGSIGVNRDASDPRAIARWGSQAGDDDDDDDDDDAEEEEEEEAAAADLMDIDIAAASGVDNVIVVDDDDEDAGGGHGIDDAINAEEFKEGASASGSSTVATTSRQQQQHQLQPRIVKRVTFHPMVRILPLPGQPSTMEQHMPLVGRRSGSWRHVSSGTLDLSLATDAVDKPGLVLDLSMDDPVPHDQRSQLAAKEEERSQLEEAEEVLETPPMLWDVDDERDDDDVDDERDDQPLSRVRVPQPIGSGGSSSSSSSRRDPLPAAAMPRKKSRHALPSSTSSPSSTTSSSTTSSSRRSSLHVDTPATVSLLGSSPATASTPAALAPRKRVLEYAM